MTVETGCPIDELKLFADQIEGEQELFGGPEGLARLSLRQIGGLSDWIRRGARLNMQPAGAFVYADSKMEDDRAIWLPGPGTVDGKFHRVRIRELPVNEDDNAPIASELCIVLKDLDREKCSAALVRTASHLLIPPAAIGQYSVSLSPHPPVS